MRDFVARFVAVVVVFGGAALVIAAAVFAVVIPLVWLLGPITATLTIFGALLILIFAGITNSMKED
jgi:hypothetical protein